MTKTRTKTVAGVEMHDAPPTSWVPSRKWFVNVATLGAAVLTSWATTGWDTTETVQLIALGLAAVTTYFTPNTGN